MKGLARRASLLVAFSVFTSVAVWTPFAESGEVAEPMHMEKWSQLSPSSPDLRCWRMGLSCHARLYLPNSVPLGWSGRGTPGEVAT